jgi:hypothetical protein
LHWAVTRYYHYTHPAFRQWEDMNVGMATTLPWAVPR